MTEVASLLPSDHRLTSVRHYEAGPPIGLELVEEGDTFATTKEEEWVSKKKTEVVNTKQIETRVKRQVVLEDGKVVEDSGPMVTTNTTEDTETQEHHQTELRKLGDDEVDGAVSPKKALEGGKGGLELEVKSNWVAVANSDGLVREVKERRVVSREETEELKETEDVQHLGDITDEDFLAAVNTGRSDLRSVLRSREHGRSLVSTGPRLVHESSKSNKVTDTEDTRESSSVQPDGKIITETERTTEHEEVKDDELPEDAPEQNYKKESSERYLKTRDQEDVDYLADGQNVGHEMRFRTETMEVERRGDGGVDEPDFESLSARVRRRANNAAPPRQPHRYRGLENGATTTPLDRKDALTKRPLDFDQEEETRKVETSKWLENHFGSESRSSNNSTIDEEEQAAPKTSFFNVTIKSQPSRTDATPQKTYVTTTVNTQRVYSPVEPERDRNPTGFYKGISEWSERRQDYHSSERRSPMPYKSTSSPVSTSHQRSRSPIPDYRPQYSPVPDYRPHHSPTPDYNHTVVAPTPPLRKRADRHHQQRQRVVVEEKSSRYREEPPPDYSPPSPPPMPHHVAEKKQMQKTRFAPEPPPVKTKSGNIIGQSIRKLVGKIRSASAERKAARQRVKRSPSPSYQQGHIIDNIGHSGMDGRSQPVQRYYLGEDPFAGSIYGRENKYDGVRPARSSRRNREDEQRSQSTLGRFSKSTSRLVGSSFNEQQRNSQTLPHRHHSSKYEAPTRLEKSKNSNSTINVSIINTVAPSIVNRGPVKPARSLARSKSLNVHAELDQNRNMYTSNPHLHRLEENPVGLKSPALISSLSRSQRDVEEVYTTHFVRNGKTEVDTPNWKSQPIKTVRNYDIYEPPTRLRDSQTQLRRGSNSSDYSETYHTTTRNDDPTRPSVTNTTKIISKKTVPAKDGRSMETIESSETKSITKSHFRSGSASPSGVKFYETEKRYAGNPVVIEVRSSNYRK